ncbi:class I lanthipeptide [Chitinophaga sp.]|uniref:class I lanthipeptide n=1 Tax=Chitinophaga sp. TaxID=1869181 RepID=UPI0039C88E19
MKKFNKPGRLSLSKTVLAALTPRQMLYINGGNQRSDDSMGCVPTTRKKTKENVGGRDINF